MSAAAESSQATDFMARVEEAAKRDGASRDSLKLLEGYFKDLFSENDDDGNGALNYEEFKQAMDIIAPSFGPVELKGAFSAADKDGSGTVDYKEFMKRAAQFQ